MTKWKNLPDLLRDRAQSQVQRHMLFYAGTNVRPQSLSYQALYYQAHKISTIIQSIQNFGKKRPVLLHLDDHQDVVLWFWAVLFAEAVPVLSSPLSNVKDHRQKHVAALSSLLQSPICITRLDSVPLFGDGHGLEIHTIEALVCAPAQGSPIRLPSHNPPKGLTASHQVDDEIPDDLAVLMLTSGSTGNSKAVRLTHKQILASVAGKSSVRKLPSDKAFLNWIGLDHVGAFVEIHLHALWSGVDQIHARTADIIASPRLFLDLLSHHRVSRSFAPNFFLAALVADVCDAEQQGTPIWDLSDLSFLVSGGEANDLKTCTSVSALLSKYGAPPNVIAPGFGMTETCAGSIYNTNCPGYDVTRGYALASLGKCIEGMEMRIAQLNQTAGATCSGEVGELQVRGSVVFDGYHRNPEATSQAFTTDGWFRTGDQATIDENGNLNLVGRVNDVININGIKLDAADIQMALEQALGSRIARLVVFATRSTSTEQVTIVYTPRQWPLQDTEMLEISEIATGVCTLNWATRPIIMSLRKESICLLPTSALGKISRAKMRILFDEGTFVEDMNIHEQAINRARGQTRTASPVYLNDTEKCLLHDFANTLHVSTDDIGVDSPFFELGFTSIDLLKLKYRIDTRLGRSVPIIVLLKNPTVRSLALALGLEPSALTVRHTFASSTKYEPVVMLQSAGKKAPLWLVHPGVGEVLVFIGLAKEMADDDRPIFALRARGFEEGQPFFESITEAVNIYVAAIRRVQSRGPYALAGYSYGAMLAFEIAKRLETQDGIGTVRFLGSFNLPPHIKLRMRQLDQNMCLLNLAYFIGLISERFAQSINEADFRAMSYRAALEFVLSVAEQSRLSELGLTQQDLTRWADLAYGLQSMAVNYEPTGQVECIDVFQSEPLKIVAKSREEWFRDSLSKWKDFSRSEPVFHNVDGAHYTIIGQDHVATFSVILRSALKARKV